MIDRGISTNGSFDFIGKDISVVDLHFGLDNLKNPLQYSLIHKARKNKLFMPISIFPIFEFVFFEVMINQWMDILICSFFYFFRL